MIATGSAVSTAVQLLLIFATLAASINGQEFIFSNHLKLDGATEIMPNGSSTPGNATGLRKGQVFYAEPLKFKSSQTSNTLSSFSTSFVVSINLETGLSESNTEGFSFIISSSKWLPLHSMVLEEENSTKLEETSSLILINFKISRNSSGSENNHLEITINGVPIAKHSPLGYYRKLSDKLRELSITRGQFTQVWLEYDGKKKEISVTVAPVSSSGPTRHSFSYPLDIEPHVSDDMFVGISLSTSWLVKPLYSNYYLLGWSMKLNGKAQDLDLDEIFKFNPNEVFGSQITNGIEEFSPQTLMKFTCLSCLEKYLRMMNCSTEQIEALERQCLMVRDTNNKEFGSKKNIDDGFQLMLQQ